MTKMEKFSVNGRCQCDAIRFTINDPPQKAIACHCTVCRRIQGNYAIDVITKREAVSIKGENTLTWYQSSDKCQRGFCPVCGASLFAQYEDGMFVVAAGALDAPTGIQLSEHIFVSNKGDYYDIADNLPQSP